MTFSVLLAPPGVGLRGVEASLSNDGIDVGDVEDTLLTLPAVREDPEIRMIEEDELRLRDILEVFPHGRVIELWANALELTIAQLSQRAAEHQVIAFHPTLFAARRSEQYSLISKALTSIRLRDAVRVVLLIDDLYDMWHRLGRTSDGLFNHNQWLETRATAQELDFYLTFDDDTNRLGIRPDAPPIAKSMFNRLVLGSSMSILEHLLQWRHLDMVEAETFAAQLGDETDLVALGVKHPRSALLSLLKSASRDDPVTAYLSHPISRPRREQASSGQWPPVVDASNELSSQLARRGVVLVCPTAIDEFRFKVFRPDPAIQYNKEELALAAAADLAERGFELATRWKSLTKNANDAIVSNKEPSSTLSYVPLADTALPEEVTATFARSLEEAIYAEVPFRDHYLVAHTNTFLIYRPLYSEGKFSGGVGGEIAHWSDSFLHGEDTRRALYVHSPQDLRDWSSSSGSTHFPGEIQRVAHTYLGDQRRTDADIERILASARPRPGTLDLGKLTKAEEKLRARAYAHAGERVLFSRLTQLSPSDFFDHPEVPVGILVLEYDAASESELNAIARFLGGGLSGEAGQLEGGTPVVAFPTAQIQSILGMSPGEWAMSVVKNAPGE